MEVGKCNFTINIVIDMDSKNIIFFGGTGLIGNSVLNLLNKKESKIYAFSRQNLSNKFENVSLHGRGWDDWRLVLRYTFSSSSRQLCDASLGVFSNLENFFTYRVAPRSCVRSHVSAHNTVESRS